MRLRFLVPLLVLAVAACTTSGAPASRPRTNRSILTTDELKASQHMTLLGMIRSERPHWLTTAQATVSGRATAVTVYQDNFRLGGVELLDMFRPSTIYSVQYYSASQAEARYGVGHEGGVIHVRTTPRR